MCSPTTGATNHPAKCCLPPPPLGLFPFFWFSVCAPPLPSPLAVSVTCTSAYDRRMSRVSAVCTIQVRGESGVGRGEALALLALLLLACLVGMPSSYTGLLHHPPPPRFHTGIRQWMPQKGDYFSREERFFRGPSDMREMLIVHSGRNFGQMPQLVQARGEGGFPIFSLLPPLQ